MTYWERLFAAAMMGADNERGRGAALTAPDRDQHLNGGADMAHDTHTPARKVKL